MSTHDFTRPTRGHAPHLSLSQDSPLILTGFVHCRTRVQTGDFLILLNKGKTTRYLVTEARSCMDPDDMYHVTAKFAPRTTNQP